MNEFNDKNFQHRPPHRGSQRGFGPGFGGPGPRGGFFNPPHPGDFGRQFGGIFAGPDRRTPRGGIRLGLLALINEGSQNGYSLMQAFAAKTNGNWQPKSGSIYPVLNQLVDEGLVTVDEQGVYTITEQGRLVLTSNQEQITSLFQRFSDHQRPVVFEALGRLMPALHQFARQSTSEQQADIAAKIDDLRKEIYRKLGE